MSFVFPGIFTINKFYIIYSIMDNYEASQNFINKLYSLEYGYNQEHLIVYDNRKIEVEWWDAGKCAEKFSLNEVEGVRELKKYSLNYLIIDKELNRSLGIKDIVEKIDCIENFFTNVPKHINLILSFIKELDSFNELKEIKGQTIELEQIKIKYIQFVNEYFSEENQERFIKLMGNEFIGSFQN